MVNNVQCACTSLNFPEDCEDMDLHKILDNHMCNSNITITIQLLTSTSVTDTLNNIKWVLLPHLGRCLLSNVPDTQIDVYQMQELLT